MKVNLIKDKSFGFAVRIVNLYRLMCGERSEFIMSKQLMRSGTSVGANVREAANAQSPADFIHKLSVAQKECDETLYWIELMRETGYLNDDEFSSIHSDANEIYAILTRIIVTSKNKLK